ncbi:MAG: hypothetical protein HOV87_12195 [Catenulispora sp.]|nr:hypothetical protein [Catenulispora sp.]NUT39992.1 hypothetical protein [Thermoactinospora sp.]
MNDKTRCPGCQVAPGHAHEDTCAHARCPACGEQALTDDCDTDQPALWHGVDQRAEVARALNWWTTAPGVDHLVEDYTRVLFAIAYDQIAWEPQAQRYVIGQIDEAMLDRVAGR